MDFFSDLVQSPAMQGLVFGPLISVLLGVLFSGLSSAPRQREPLTVYQTREVYRERVIERRSSGQANDDGAGLLLFLGFGLLIILWQYAIHVIQVQHYLTVALLSLLSFSVVTMVISYFKGHFTSQGWWVYTLAPVVILAVCTYVLVLAKESFDPRITETALGKTFLEFYLQGLTNYGRAFMVTHVGGVLFLVVTMVMTGLSLLFYLSLMNQRSYSTVQAFWSFMVRVTSFFSRPVWLVLAVFCLVLAYLGINPKLAAMWLL